MCFRNCMSVHVDHMTPVFQVAVSVILALELEGYVSLSTGPHKALLSTIICYLSTGWPRQCLFALCNDEYAKWQPFHRSHVSASSMKDSGMTILPLPVCYYMSLGYSYRSNLVQGFSRVLCKWLFLLTE